ncbi:MAG TPA: thiamine phosphate synthase, partial [Dokdonella sp.]|nr:thiamine phosphate synthase [Dokdonella sp.]
LAGGACVVQYRDKTDEQARRRAEAAMLRELCAEHGVPLVINDDVALAIQCRAAGVHLGAGDADIATARKILGEKAIIGVSCYDSLQRARDAVRRGASYVAFGAFFPSLSKPRARSANPDILRTSKLLGVPRVAIGGITPDNARILINAGADCVAVISSLFGAADIKAEALRFSRLFSDPTRQP